MRERSYREYSVGALWRTLEERPRYLRILGRAAAADDMMIAELELQDRPVWLQQITGRVYDQGVLLGQAECVELGERDDPYRRD